MGLRGEEERGGERRREEERENVGVVCVLGGMDGKEPFLVCKMDVCACVDQEVDDICMAFQAGCKERRGALAVGLVDVCTCVDQDAEDRGVAKDGGQAERGGAVQDMRFDPVVDVCPRLEEE